MGFWQKLFGGGKKADAPAPAAKSAGEPAPATAVPEAAAAALGDEAALLNRHAAIALEGQGNLGELIGERNWNVDLQAGVIEFGDDLRIAVQEMGTYSHQGGDWMWIWANEQADTADDVMRDARDLRERGERAGASWLTEPRREMAFNDLHRLGVMIGGLTGADAYFVGDYGSGAVLLTLRDERIRNMRPRDAAAEAARMLTYFPQVLGVFDLDHRAAWRAYAGAKGFAVTEHGAEIHATRAAQDIVASFDEQGRLTNLRGNLAAADDAPGI